MIGWRGEEKMTSSENDIKEPKQKEIRLQLLFSSINDIQGTIRAIDTKIGLLLLIQLFPFSYLGSIIKYLSNTYPQQGDKIFVVIYFVCIILFTGTWALSIIASLNAIISINTPSKHIKVKEEVQGSYFASDLFRFNFLDVYFNRASIMSKCSLTQIVSALPHNAEKLINELTFEQMKLAYIRDIKIIRQKWALWLLVLWLVEGFIWYLFSYSIK